jgi:Divergent 4Fe-4S mono-cluster
MIQLFKEGEFVITQFGQFYLAFNLDGALHRIIRGSVAERQRKAGGIVASQKGKKNPVARAGLFSKKPWIDLNGAFANATAEQVTSCPSGAPLTYGLVKKAE